MNALVEHNLKIDDTYKKNKKQNLNFQFKDLMVNLYFFSPPPLLQLINAKL
jgi:hypothetical protein